MRISGLVLLALFTACHSDPSSSVDTDLGEPATDAAAGQDAGDPADLSVEDGSVDDGSVGEGGASEDGALGDGGLLGDGSDSDAGDGGPSFYLSELQPGAASRTASVDLTLRGAGLLAGATVTLTGCDPIALPDGGAGMTTIELGAATVGGGGQTASVMLPADPQRPQGLYSVTLTNPGGATARLDCRLLVSGLPAPTVTQVQPGSAWQGTKGDGVLSDQAVTITGTGFVPTPDVLLRHRMTGQIFHASQVSWVSATSVSAVVPSESQAMPLGDYDLSVTNPDLLTGTWSMPFRVTGTSPPVIQAVSPVSASNATCPVAITLTGSGFQAGMTAAFIVPPGTACPAGSTAGTDLQGNALCSITVSSVGGSGTSAALTAGCLGLGLYPIEVRNPDAQYGIFASFGFTPSSAGHFNGGSVWEAGPNPSDAASRWPQLKTGRWRHGFAYGFDEFGGTWLATAGGQASVTGAPLSTVEVAQVDVFGRPGQWVTSQQFRSAAQPRVNNTLGGLDAPQGRTGLELLRAGRWLYAVGGANVNTNDQTVRGAVTNPGDQGTLRTVERAEILGYGTMPLLQQPTWTPGTGLPLWTWYYRVSGVTAQGESLPSTAAQAINAQGVVHLRWAPPPAGAAATYNIYRSLAADGRGQSERLLATGVTGTTFDDNGQGALTPAPGRLRGAIVSGGTLVNGTYRYRVSACTGNACSDADRSGETLAGYAAEIVIDGTTGRTISLSWDPIPNARYRVFKYNDATKAYEQVAKDVTDAMKPWLDDGTAVPTMPVVAPKDGVQPLPPGSLSTWTTLPQMLVHAREGLDGVVLRMVDGRGLLYVGGGRESTASATPYLKTFERAMVDPATGDLSAWSEQTAHPLTNPRAFFALLTTQDRELTPTAPQPKEPPCPDFDADGYPACYCYTGTATACGISACDCNDGDPAVHPCATDVCGDGIAQDCKADVACPMTCQTPDVDKDAHRAYACGGDDCCDTGMEGTTWQGGLSMMKPGTLGCSAANAAGIYPGAVEVCGDGIDQNCDGVDPACPMGCTTDNDKDGFIACSCYPNGAPSSVTCNTPSGSATVGKCDCNDNDPKVYPCAPDLVYCDGVAQNCVADVCVIFSLPTASPKATRLTRRAAPAAASTRFGISRAATTNQTEWLVAVGGGNTLTATANGQTNNGTLASIEACAVDLVTGDLVRCDAGETAMAPWAVQGPNTQTTGVGLDGLLYSAGASPFLLSWPGSKTEVLGGAPATPSGNASRFSVDTTHTAGTMTADPAKVVTGFQSNSSSFVFDRSYYRMVRVSSYVFVLGGYGAAGPLGTIERHQQ